MEVHPDLGNAFLFCRLFLIKLDFSNGLLSVVIEGSAGHPPIIDPRGVNVFGPRVAGPSAH
jgi:hypothetical protein